MQEQITLDVLYEKLDGLCKTIVTMQRLDGYLDYHSTITMMERFSEFRLLLKQLTEERNQAVEIADQAMVEGLSQCENLRLALNLLLPVSEIQPQP